MCSRPPRLLFGREKEDRGERTETLVDDGGEEGALLSCDRLTFLEGGESTSEMVGVGLDGER